MSILFNSEGLLYHKIYTQIDIDEIANNMKIKNDVYDDTVLSMLIQTSPADDIRYLNAFVYWDLNEPISIEWFPKNWNYEKIIGFLINKYNNKIYSFSWDEEIKPDAQKYGLYKKNDFNEPYTKTDK